MGVDYSRGRYVVTDANGNVVGRIDCDEFVRAGSRLVYRIEDEAVYDMSGMLLAYVDDGVAMTPQGSKLFTIKSE